MIMSIYRRYHVVRFVGIIFLIPWILLILVKVVASSTNDNNNNNRQGWRKFSVVVLDRAGDIFVPPTSPGPGTFLVKDNAVLNSRRTFTIGRSSMRCLVLPALNGGTSTSSDCIWIFDLRLSNSQPGQLMLQGSYHRNVNLQNSLDPNQPPTQFVGITGGTGVFTGAYGVARILPLDLTAQTPLWGFTFYLKVPRGSSSSSSSNGSNNNNNNDGYNW
jgi:hypothetical protein